MDSRTCAQKNNIQTLAKKRPENCYKSNTKKGLEKSKVYKLYLNFETKWNKGMNRIIPVMAIMMAYLGACTKQEKVQIDGNEPPDYSGVPTIMVENYVNRLYIDLLGREATNEERKLFTD